MDPSGRTTTAAAAATGGAGATSSFRSKAEGYYNDTVIAMGRKITPNVRFGIQVAAHLAVTVTAVSVAVMVGSTFTIAASIIGSLTSAYVAYKHRSSEIESKLSLRHLITGNAKTQALFNLAGLGFALVPSAPVKFAALGLLALASYANYRGVRATPRGATQEPATTVSV